MKVKQRRPGAGTDQTGRSKSAKAGERFIRLPHWMLACPAWIGLSGDGLKVLLHLWQRHNGANNGSIAYSVRDGEAIGLSKNITARALVELKERGFLLEITAGDFKQKRLARTWAITAEPIGDAPATKTFMRWAVVSHQRDTKSPANPPQKASKVAPKSKTQSHQRDKVSHQRDTNGFDATILAPTVPPVGLSGDQSPSLQSHQRDTYSLPCTPEAEPAPVVVDAAPLAEPIKQPRRADRRATVRQHPASDHGEPHQIDLEELIAASLTPGKPTANISGAAPRCVPADVVRERIKAEGIKIGELAKALGVAGPTMSNRLSPRHAERPTKFSLNATAEAALSAWVAGRPLPGRGAIH